MKQKDINWFKKNLSLMGSYQAHVYIGALKEVDLRDILNSYNDISFRAEPEDNVKCMRFMLLYWWKMSSEASETKGKWIPEPELS